MPRPLTTMALAALAVLAGASGIYLLQAPGAKMTAPALPATRPALETVRLRGSGMSEDSLALAIHAAAGAFGLAPDDEVLSCLSGAPFAPAIDTSESCASWWHVKAHSSSSRIPAMARAVALQARMLASPVAGQSDADSLASATPLVRRALGSGAVVLSEGGWEEPGAWDFAGIVTAVTEDGTICGATLSASSLEGRSDVPLRYARTIWALTPSDQPAPSASQVDADILETAVRRIRGDGEFQAADQALFGIAAIERWIAQMNEVRGFCHPCFAREPVTGVHDAADNDRRMYAAAQVASRQLQRIAGTAPADVGSSIEQAADCYDRIAELLAPGATGRFSYDTLSSLDAQRQYARDVLLPAKTELAWAAAHIERALLISEGGKLLPHVLAAYDPLARSYSDMNPIRSDLLMREVCLKSAGVMDVSYDELVMLAGFGTTFAYHPNRYYYAYQTPDNPEVTEQRLAEGSGVEFIRPPKTQSPEDAWKLVKQVIDSGRPLQASWLDDFIIAGYLDSPEPSRRQVYTLGKWSLAGRMNWTEWTDWHQRFGTLAYPSASARRRSSLTRDILERIVEWGRHDNRHFVEFMREGRFSFDGMNAYADDVADPAKPASSFDGAWLACHAINRQWASRRCAANWLAGVASNQPEAARERITHASNLYARSYDLWRQYRMTLGGEDSAARWARPEARKLGAELLRQAVQLEQQAVEEIAAVLPLISSEDLHVEEP